jgi:hypothetical protein
MVPHLKKHHNFKYFFYGIDKKSANKINCKMDHRGKLNVTNVTKQKVGGKIYTGNWEECGEVTGSL